MSAGIDERKTGGAILSHPVFGVTQRSTLQKRNWLAISTVLATVLLLQALVVWAEVSPATLRVWGLEDGPFEYATALLYLVTGVLFVLFLRRSEFLRTHPTRWRYALTVTWAVVCFVIAGEEISWGQRILDLDTPEAWGAINEQNELTLHNLTVIDQTFGGQHRLQSLMMFVIGLGMPLFARLQVGARLLRSFALPVPPLRYISLFVGAYFFGRHYFPAIGNSALEVREFLMALGMLCFALHGVLHPAALFRLKDEASEHGDPA